MWYSESFEVKYNVEFGITIEFPSQRKKIKSVHKQEIGRLWSSESFEGKYNIGFGILIEFQSQRKEIFESVHNNKLNFCGPVSHLRESTISDLESQLNFQVKEKNYLNRTINNEIRKLDFCGTESHLRESTIS